MESDALTLYKLMILFALDKVDFPLTNAQISNFILDRDYTNYFNIQQAVSELIDSELVHCRTIRNSTLYTISEAGQETLEFFNHKISDAIKEDILDYLRTNNYSMREEVSTLSDYYEVRKDEYIARFQVKEKDNTIIDLSLLVPSEDVAEAMCNNWKERSQEIYSYLMNSLMKN